MTRPVRTFAFTLFLALCIFLGRAVVSVSASAAECDSCKYDGSDAADADDNDCKVYGQLGDDVLIAYNKASQDCLDAHSIKVEAVDATMLSSMFPNANGTDANVNALVSFLKNDGGAAVNAILLSMDFFFVEAAGNGNGQKPVFLDSIIVEGITYDCTASESDCWNALKTYFANTQDGQDILQSVGQDLYAKAAVGRELEQSTVRIAICNNGAMATDGSCDALAAQIEELKTANPDKACSAFGLGPAENAIPGCDDNNDGNDETTTAQDTGNSTSRGSTTTTSSATTIATATGWFMKSHLLLPLLPFVLALVF